MNNNAFVIGSYVLLHNFVSKTLPDEGETVIAQSFTDIGGGKGTNQAYAIRLFDVNVEVIGRVGNDDAGKSIIEKFAPMQIGYQYIHFDDEHSTGRGSVLKDVVGKNKIAIFPGASDYFSKMDFDKAKEWVKQCKIGGFQLEVNVDTIEYALKKTHELDVKTFLDPAPVAPLHDTTYHYINYIKPNEHEASLLTGTHVHDVKSSVEAGKWFLDRGVNEAAIITLGKQGAVLVTRDGYRVYPPAKVKAVDTAAAGDSFAGGFISAIAKGKTLHEAMIDAICASAVTVTIRGSLYAASFNDCRKDVLTIRESYKDVVEEKYYH